MLILSPIYYWQLKLILYTCTSELLDKLKLKFSFQLSSQSQFANLVRIKKL